MMTRRNLLLGGEYLQNSQCGEERQTQYWTKYERSLFEYPGMTTQERKSKTADDLKSNRQSPCQPTNNLMPDNQQSAD